MDARAAAKTQEFLFFLVYDRRYLLLRSCLAGTNQSVGRCCVLWSTSEYHIVVAVLVLASDETQSRHERIVCSSCVRLSVAVCYLVILPSVPFLVALVETRLCLFVVCARKAISGISLVSVIFALKTCLRLCPCVCACSVCSLGYLRYTVPARVRPGDTVRDAAHHEEQPQGTACRGFGSCM